MVVKVVFAIILSLFLTSLAFALSPPTGLAIAAEGNLEVGAGANVNNITLNANARSNASANTGSDDSDDSSGFGTEISLGNRLSFGKYYNLSNMSKEEVRAQLRENMNVTLSNGRNVTIKIMPEVASEIAIERLGELNFTVALKEVGNADDTELNYELWANKEAKLLWVFNKKMEVSALVNVETGETSVNRPWWSFMASESAKVSN